MIKNIQKYLLTHHPIIWNTKLIPMLIVLLGVHLVFFGIGYIASDASFSRAYSYYSPFDNLGILYFVSILISILVLIGWLVFYNRNNGFKIFYPRKTSQVYLEWILILIITLGITLIPFSLTEGYISKWKSIASEKETKSALEVLDRAKVLIPDTDYSSFNYDSDYHKVIPVPKGMNLRADSIDLDDYSIQYSGSGQIIIRGYTGTSLLFFRPYNYRNYHYYKNSPQHILEENYIDTSDWAKIRRQDKVIDWLRNGDKEKILTIMKDFEKLQKEHNMSVNITPEQWFKRIYKPPFFPVDNSTKIDTYQPSHFYNNSNYNDDYYELSTAEVESITVVDVTDTAFAVEPEVAVVDDYYIEQSKPVPFLQYNELHEGYKQIMKCYDKNEDKEWLFLFCSCIGIWISLFIFSFRITSGKSWLISLVATGVLIFTVVLTTVAMLDTMDWGWENERIIVMIVLLFWVALFIALGAKIISKIRAGKEKGNSKYYINLFIWLVPCQIPLLFFTYALYVKLNQDYYNSVTDEAIICMFWINIAIVIISMWGISAFVRRWKSIADE